MKKGGQPPSRVCQREGGPVYLKRGGSRVPKESGSAVSGNEKEEKRKRKRNPYEQEGVDAPQNQAGRRAGPMRGEEEGTSQGVVQKGGALSHCREMAMWRGRGGEEEKRLREFQRVTKSTVGTSSKKCHVTRLSSLPSVPLLPRCPPPHGNSSVSSCSR